MKRHVKKVIIVTLLSVALTGCAAKEANNIDNNKNTKIETNQEEKTGVLKDFEVLVADKPELGEVKGFIDDNISKADEETADRMIEYLIELQKKGIEEEINYFYSDNNIDIHEKIKKAYEKDSSKFERAYVFAGDSKYFLLENMEDKKSADGIKKLFDKGYGLYNAEGSYYPVIDFKAIKEEYSEYLTDMTIEYLDIMSGELDQPTLVEEYLAIDVAKLKERAFRYEEFLKKYPKSPNVDDVAMNYMVCIWKLVNPNIFDGTVDEEFRVVDEMNKVYKDILSDETHPVTTQSVKGITEYIESKDGVLGSMNNMDELFKASDKLHKEAAEKVKELYLEE
ncbi:hypothetical protein R9X47_26395 [Wukongibacter baidiensis]|uniref:hypothetical protein n=1 Tax=Wukongibacter baidiensis TaxID=1723361 RepID=UPI003D7F9456